MGHGRGVGARCVHAAGISSARRRDNLRRSADELRAQLAKDEKALLELDEITVQTLSPFDLTLSMRVRVPREGNFASDYRTAA